MLTTDEEDRLVGALPLQQTVTYDGSTYTYDVSPYWYRSDAAFDGSSTSPDYPALLLAYEPDDETDERPGGLAPFAEYDFKSDGSIGVIERAHVSDELSMLVAVATGTDANGVPAGVRATQIGRALWRFVRFDLDLGEPGADGERPIGVAVEAPPARRRTSARLETEWTARLRYVAETERVVDPVEDAEYSVTVTN